jgi:hypothetical protein
LLVTGCLAFVRWLFRLCGVLGVGAATRVRKSFNDIAKSICRSGAQSSSTVSTLSNKRLDAVGMGLQKAQSAFWLREGARRLSYCEGLVRPLVADTVAKVENRTTLKISRKPIFRRLHCCKALQRRYEGPWSFLSETMRSLTSTHAKPISGPRKFRPSSEKDFFNTIGAKRTFARSAMSAKRFGLQTRGTFASPFQLGHPGREGGCHSEPWKLFRSDLAR